MFQEGLKGRPDNALMHSNLLFALHYTPAARPDVAKLKALWRELDDRAARFFADASFPRDQVRAIYQMNMRYRGQNWALTFDIETRQGEPDYSFVDETIGQRAIEAFNRRHMEEYGHLREGEMPEITGVRLATCVATPAPAVAAGFGAPVVAATTSRARRANLGAGYAETAVFRGVDLRPGYRVAGPAIIEETFTTIVVYPGWTARVDDAGDYELSRVQP